MSHKMLRPFIVNVRIRLLVPAGDIYMYNGYGNVVLQLALLTFITNLSYVTG